VKISIIKEIRANMQQEKHKNDIKEEVLIANSDKRQLISL